ncbi:sensor histidine kinase [Pseudohoeflea coraliihabitans]|uniref:histidine kinase n=1 Tax=Pseudohoeflea coraliihabitans TaxID=2860393 RepID=A0ABS6WT38_9HYPH|nr:ATP-binding protein [Pseudohoeflea sp. DP4N28-3]MBW3099106.1 PAS-domain containing protein [Pseudohoeflea sp. DP4N28-3]
MVVQNQAGAADRSAPKERGESKVSQLPHRKLADRGSGASRLGHYHRLCRRLAASISILALTPFLASPLRAAAEPVAAEPAVDAIADTLSSFDVINFAMVIGAVSAAMISAIWLIRERGKIDLENRALRVSLADATARAARYQSLIIDRNRRIVVWEGVGVPAEILGSLPSELGAPDGDREFMAFEGWLQLASARKLDEAIDRLRSQAEQFEMTLETRQGRVLEAQGRVAGGRAFVRFVALSNLRAELAGLQAENTRLNASLDLLQNLLDVIDMPVWLRDPAGEITWVNAAYAEAVEVGDRQQAIEGKLELLGSAARERIKMTLTPERPFLERVSTVIRGHRRFMEVADVKTPAGQAGLAYDVSDIEDVREELNRTLNSHSEMLDQLATPVAIFDRDQRLQFFNHAFQQLWDLDLGFLERRPDNGEFLEKLRSEGKVPEPHSWRDWKEEVLTVYRAVDTEPQLWHLPDGQTLNVIANAHPRGGATWIFENLTEKMDLETRYNTLVRVQGETIDNLAEGVCVFGPDGKIKLSNTAFRALWGLSEEETRPGTHIREIARLCQPSHDAPEGWPLFLSAITGFDEDRLTRDGRIELTTGLILDYAVVPLPNAQTMIAFVNVTDSVGAARMLTEKNEALRKADALKNDFVQHVSYELRSPLTNIIGFADLLLTPGTGDLNDRQREYIDHISASSAVLLTIVNDILDLATVDAGIMQLDLDTVDVSQLLAEASEQIGSRLKENELRVEIDASAAPEEIIADHQRLKQILFKLMMNAASYAPEGSAIELTCRQEDADTVFIIADRGPGIPAELQESVFSRFATGVRPGGKGGAGLGLSIVESFVGLHHGTVRVEDRPGGGTMVICRFPSQPLRGRTAAE